MLARRHGWTQKVWHFSFHHFLEDLVGWIEISWSRMHFFDPDPKLALWQTASLGSRSKKCLVDRLISIHPAKSPKKWWNEKCYTCQVHPCFLASSHKICVTEKPFLSRVGPQLKQSMPWWCRTCRTSVLRHHHWTPSRRRFQLEKTNFHQMQHSHLKISWRDFFSRKEFLILGYLLIQNLCKYHPVRRKGPSVPWKLPTYEVPR